MIRIRKLLLLFAFFCWFFTDELHAQTKKNATNTQSNYQYEEKYFNMMRWRSIGPYRGGRSAAVTGVAGKPNLFFFGSTGGGVWKSIDAGGTWSNITDGFFGGSIGAVAISESDNNIIYVGGGEKTVRGNVSHGDGMWKSLDGGKTWKSIGLTDSRHITRIRIHPQNPDIVYVAALGHLFGPNEERGVFRTKDGGKTWEKVLFANSQAGAIDLIIDPNNARVLYASTWRVIRTPYSLESGGEGSALWKSTDGGDTWVELTKNSKGLPKTALGIIGITVSPANSDRLWAIIEAQEGGVFRSDDGGNSWTKVNEERKLRQRAWYYSRIYADPKNQDMVYVLNVDFHRSKDGGRTYESIDTPHGDHHDLWIDPNEPLRMIIGDDGGAQVSMDGGESWSTYMNQPTGQFYRVVTDNAFPYRIYGGQQDNSAIRISSFSVDGAITEANWQNTAGGESAHLAPHPTKKDVVFGTSYGGYFTRYDHATGEEKAVDIYPDNPMGHGAIDSKYRFQWNFPIAFSPHQAQRLYAGANVLFQSDDEGISWTAISPDLTRNDPEKLKSSGGPITQDNTSVEYYCTIFAFAESPIAEGLIWVGSDDGLVHITQDGGKNWQNVTPKDMPEWMMINCVEPDPFNKAVAYIAGTKYKSDDFQPYLYKTEDYGKTWKKITNGIDQSHFTRAIRADKVKKDLLYAGTERGMYVSFDGGQNWQPLQLNLPIVPITDLAVKNNDLIAATQGRSFWILDDLTPLHQLAEAKQNPDFYLYKPRDVYNTIRSTWGHNPKFNGKNPPNGVVVNFYLPELPDTAKTVTLEFLDNNNQVIRKFTNKPAKDKAKDKLEFKKGANQFIWDMRHEDAVRFDGLVLWSGGTQGPRIAPNMYQVRLSIGDKVQTQNFQLLKDPRSEATDEDLKMQLSFLLEIRDKLSQTHRAIIQIRKIRKDIENINKRFEGQAAAKEVMEKTKDLNTKITAIEEVLYQTKNQSSQDPLNYPIRLNNKLSSLASLCGMSNGRPTQSMVVVKNEITKLIDIELEKLKTIVDTEIPAFNQWIKEKDLPAISTEMNK
ncbi:MAG: glycosyl hydrolase [Cytophagales bacterium]|nr:MAG: glycosyl hydrolase [Cytophagales bacterium]